MLTGYLRRPDVLSGDNPGVSVGTATMADTQDEDHVEKLLKKAGCLELHYKVQECIAETRDWRKCQDQVKSFKQCMDSCSILSVHGCVRMGSWVDYYSGLISGVCLGVAGVMVFKFTNLRSLFAGISKKSDRVPARVLEDCKMVLVVRTDLNMGKGKIAAQCCHAALGSYKCAEKHSPHYLAKWVSRGQPKIVVKLDNKDGEVKLYELEKLARNLGVPCKVIHDAGHTQVQSGTATCAGFGPAPSSLLDRITGQLKLL